MSLGGNARKRSRLQAQFDENRSVHVRIFCACSEKARLAPLFIISSVNTISDFKFCALVTCKRVMQKEVD